MARMQNADEERRTSILRFALYWLIAAVLIATFLSRFILVPLLFMRLGVAFVLACASVVAIAGTGALALRVLNRFARDEAPRAHSFAFCAVIGYPLFGALCFLAGLASTSRVVMSVLLLLSVLAAARVLRPLMPSTGSFSAGPAAAAGLMLIATALLPVLGMAQLPASSLDELAYHLAIPQAWVVEGRAVDLPLLSQSYFPLGTESADLPLLAILGTDGAIASHFVHLFIALAVMFLIHEWLRRRTSHSTSLLALAGIVTCPALLITAGWSWNDWAVTGTVVALLLALEDHGREGTRTSASAVAVLLAAGMLTKYTFYPVAAGLVLACIATSSEMRSRIRPHLPIFLIGLAAGSLFLIRNLILTGNPFAPFLQDHAPSVSHYREATSAFAKAAGYIFDGTLIDESLGVTILLLAAAAIPAWASLRNQRFLLASWCVTLSTGAGVYVLGPSSRVLLPWLVVLALIGTAGLAEVLTGGIHRRALRAVLVVLCSAQLLLVWFYTERLDPFATLSGRDTDESYLARHRESFAASQIVNRSLTGNSKALAVGVTELYWFTTPVRGGGNFDGPRVAAYLEAPSPEALLERLRRDGFTHVLIYPAGIRTEPVPVTSRREERETYLPPQTLVNLKTVTEQHGALVASGHGALVYSID